MKPTGVAFDHAAACASVGLAQTAETVPLDWNAALLEELSEAFGFTSIGIRNCCAQSMWCDLAAGVCFTDAYASTCFNWGPTFGPAGSMGLSHSVFTCEIPE